MTMDTGGAYANPPLVRAANAGGVTVSVVLTGSQGIRSPDQAGTVVLNAANAYSGDTEIAPGTLKLGAATKRNCK